MSDAVLQGVAAVREFGPLGLAAFALAFVAAGFLPTPRPALCIFGGFVYGFAIVPIILLSVTLGAGLALLLSRRLLRNHVVGLSSRWPKIGLVLDAIESEGWRLVVLLRLASPIPSSLLNYATGLTALDVRAFCWATLVGISPQVLLYVYLGVVGETVLADGVGSGAQLAMLMLGLATTAIAVALVVRRSRRRLRT